VTVYIAVADEHEDGALALLHSQGIEATTGRGKPWERMRGETFKAFEAFVIYRDLGPARSVEAVKDVLQAGGTPKGVSLLYRWSTGWDWRERAEAWDDYADARKRERDEIERVESRKRLADEHMKLAKMGRLVAERWLQEFGTPDKPGARAVATLTGQEITRFMQVCVQIERMGAGATTDRLQYRDVQKVVDALIELALRYVPDDAQDAFLADLDEMVGSAA
jgi:hypothetical protein